MRLNKYLALTGVCSRRKSDELIKEGRILVNGEKAHLGTFVCEHDVVECDHVKVSLDKKVYFIFNKPPFVLTTLSDPHGRKTIKDFLGGIPYRIFPVGRLDYESHGLILLTNDGDLAHRVQHPKYQLEKIYLVKTSRDLAPKELTLFEQGIELEEAKTAASQIQKISPQFYKITLHQGLKRQIRRMLKVFEIEVLDLERVQVGNLHLNNLKAGELFLLEEKAIKILKRKLFC
jgi:23S rRNA pseudouridine2605 synthase